MISQKEREKLEELISLIFELQSETWPPQDQKKNEVLNQLVQYAQILGLKADPQDPQFLQILLIRLLEDYQKPFEQIPNIPPNLKELVEIYEKDKEDQEKQTRKILISPQAYQQRRKMVEEFKKTILEVNPQVPEKVAETIAEITTTDTLVSLPPVAQPEFFPKEAEKKVAEESQKIIKENLQKIGQKPQKEIPTEKIIEQAKQLAAQPVILEASKKIVTQGEKEKPLVFQELPPEIIQKLNEATQKEGYSPTYTLFHPKALGNLIQRTFYTLPAKIVQTTASEAPPEFQLMAQGIFTQDFQTTANLLKSWGLEEKHPLLQYLKNQAAHFEELQKTIPVKNRREDVIRYQESPDILILKRYFAYAKRTGKWQASIDYGGQKINLISSPRRLWDESGYGSILRQTIDRFRFSSRIYQRVFRFLTRGKYNSLGAWTQKFVYGKVLKPLLIKLGKTAVGQAVKTGAKRAAIWLAKKAGIKLGMWAIGAAAAPESMGISLLIAAAVEIGTKILGKAKNLLVRIFKDPEKALTSIGVGVLVLVFVPMPIALIGILPIALGVIGLVSFTLAPTTLTAIGGGFSAFFTTITTLPFTFPVALFIIALFGALAGLTLFVVMVVSGAFILPGKLAEVTPTTISPYQSEYFNITKTFNLINTKSQNKIENSELGKAEIEYTVTIEAKKENKLTVNSLTETISVTTKENKTLTVTPHDFTEELSKNNKVSLGNPLIIKYKIKPPNFFEDSAIINTINASIAVEKEIGIHPGVASAVVIIGNPPMDCPSGWPVNVAGALIKQGPGGTYSHLGQQAIDISVSNGTPIYATHEGYVRDIRYSGGGGIQMKIVGVCNGVSFSSYYAHLMRVVVSEGQFITKGSLIAESDNTGISTGPHLHYEFLGLEMVPPYIPISIPWGCDGICGKI